ncbi:hypothetical protein DL89DRAFT_2850 [Linderina pennispora]|uniref:Uncharacterized protein n=1 Tax=Linderina pennispora TaxID=61395 RepID=A0A1Y1WJG0_9FUNG|nr:uncharacterized protein DL89DRAFT_2850 [Linderina pennispora]ORX73710.1 hypothetical protein DL89DRAFT_2850 [Linderina pennispora]
MKKSVESPSAGCSLLARAALGLILKLIVAAAVDQDRVRDADTKDAKALEPSDDVVAARNVVGLERVDAGAGNLLQLGDNSIAVLLEQLQALLGASKLNLVLLERKLLVEVDHVIGTAAVITVLVIVLLIVAVVVLLLSLLGGGLALALDGSLSERLELLLIHILLIIIILVLLVLPLLILLVRVLVHAVHLVVEGELDKLGSLLGQSSQLPLVQVLDINIVQAEGTHVDLVLDVLIGNTLLLDRSLVLLRQIVLDLAVKLLAQGADLGIDLGANDHGAVAEGRQVVVVAKDVTDGRQVGGQLLVDDVLELALVLALDGGSDHLLLHHMGDELAVELVVALVEGNVLVGHGSGKCRKACTGNKIVELRRIEKSRSRLQWPGPKSLGGCDKHQNKFF